MSAADAIVLERLADELELRAVERQLMQAVSVARAPARRPDPRDAAVDDVAEAVRAMLAAPRRDAMTCSRRDQP